MKTLLGSSKITLYLDEVISLFDNDAGVKTISDFVKKVEVLSENFIDDEKPADKQEKLNTFKGDMLELLAEIFFYIFQSDPAVGLSDYVPVELSEDYGVDAIGLNVNGDKCAVQVKYRSNPVEQILYEDLSKTYCAGREAHNVAIDKPDTLWLITTCDGANKSSHKVLKEKLRVINKSIIANYIDNNKTFWSQAEEIIMFTLDSLNNQNTIV
jgi:hypothetical protein